MPRRATDPYLGFRFLVHFGKDELGSFSECTGLQAETKVVEYVEGGRNGTTLKFPEATTYANVTLKRGLSASQELHDWLRDVAAGAFRIRKRPGPTALDEALESIVRTRTLSIFLLPESGGKHVKHWALVRAFPVKWIGPDLKAGASEVAIETLELAHEGIVPL